MMTVPYGCSLGRAREFFLSKKSWIEKRVDAARENNPVKIENGAIVLLFGENKEIRLIKSGRNAYLSGEYIYLPDGDKKNAIFEKFLKEELIKSRANIFRCGKKRRA